MSIRDELEHSDSILDNFQLQASNLKQWDSFYEQQLLDLQIQTSQRALSSHFEDLLKIEDYPKGLSEVFQRQMQYYTGGVQVLIYQCLLSDSLLPKAFHQDYMSSCDMDMKSVKCFHFPQDKFSNPDDDKR